MSRLWSKITIDPVHRAVNQLILFDMDNRAVLPGDSFYRCFQQPDFEESREEGQDTE